MVYVSFNKFRAAKVAVACLLALILLLFMAVPAKADILGQVTGNVVNVRSGAGIAHSIIGSANKGDSFVVVNREGDWYVIRYHGGVRGWINAQYLKTAANSALPSSVKAGSGSVNIRVAAGTDGALLGSFSGATSLPVSGESGYWYAVSYNGKTGYVAKWLVIADYTPKATLESSAWAPALVNAETLNLRDAPEGEILAKLANGARLYVRDSRDGWYEVESPGGAGWVHGAYIVFDQAKTSTQAPAENQAPSFSGTQAQGRIEVEWRQENFGYQLYLHGSTLIRYELQEQERRISIITDMEFVGALPNGEGMQISIEGEFANVLTISSGDILHYSLTEEDHGSLLMLSVGLSPLLGRLIYIDPGHASVNENGKIDPGAMREDMQEKDIVYEIALHMLDILGNMGAEVMLSRGEITDLTLERRAWAANAAGADILVSVHVNAAANTNASGSSTWFHAPADDDSYDRAACKLLAECIQRALLDSGVLDDYGVREANFAVLRASEMPAVLVEAAFISNEGDFAKLADPNFRRLLAVCICRGISEYFKL